MVSREKREMNRANVRGGEGERGGVVGADGQGPAAVPRGRRATVSAGLELAQLSAGLPGIKQEPHTVAESPHTHTHTHRKQTSRGSWISTHSESKVCIQHVLAHTHSQSESWALCQC